SQFVAPASPPVAPVSPPVSNCARAETHWKSAEEIKTVEVYQDHLARFPNCDFATLAMARITQLKADRTLSVNTDRTINGLILANAPNGVLVVRVETAAASVKIQPNDVIVEVNQKHVANADEFEDAIKDYVSLGRRTAVLLVKDVRGELKFVALPL